MQFAEWARPELRAPARRLIEVMRRWETAGMPAADVRQAVDFVNALIGADLTTNDQAQVVHKRLEPFKLIDRQAECLVWAAAGIGSTRHTRARASDQWDLHFARETARRKQQRALADQIAAKAAELVALLQDPLVRHADERFPPSVVSMEEIEHRPGRTMVVQVPEPAEHNAVVKFTQMPAWIAPSDSEPLERKYPDAPPALWKSLERVVKDLAEWSWPDGEPASSAATLIDEAAGTAFVSHAGKWRRVKEPPVPQLRESRKKNDRIRYASLLRLQLTYRGVFPDGIDLEHLVAAVTLLRFPGNDGVEGLERAILASLKRSRSGISAKSHVTIRALRRSTKPRIVT